VGSCEDGVQSWEWIGYLFYTCSDGTALLGTLKSRGTVDLCDCRYVPNADILALELSILG